MQESSLLAYSIQSAAKALEVSEDTIKRLVEEGSLTAVKVRRCTRITRQELERFLNSSTAAGR